MLIQDSGISSHQRTKSICGLPDAWAFTVQKLTLPRYQSSQELCARIEASADVAIDEEVRGLLSQQRWVSQPVSKITLVTATVADLGFPQGGYREEIDEVAREFDCTPCGSDLAPRLSLGGIRLGYREKVVFAIEPFFSETNRRLHLTLTTPKKGLLWLTTTLEPEDSVWPSSTRFGYLKNT